MDRKNGGGGGGGESDLRKGRMLRILAFVLVLDFCFTGNHGIIWTHVNIALSRSDLEDGIWLPKWQGKLNTVTFHNVICLWKNRCIPL